MCWNCPGFNNKWDEICDVICDHRTICFIFQETWQKMTKSPFVATALLEEITILLREPLDLHSRMYSNYSLFNLLCHLTIHFSSMNSIFFLMQLPTSFEILGDFNGHSLLLGSPDTNYCGQLIEDFIKGNSLCIVNNRDNC